MEIILLISVLASYALIAYSIKKATEDKINLVQEITKSLLSEDVEEYVQTLPVDELMEQIEEDELEDINDVSEKLLIKHLKAEHENIEN